MIITSEKLKRNKVVIVQDSLRKTMFVGK